MIQLKSPVIRMALILIALATLELFAVAGASPVAAQNRWDQVTTVTRRPRPPRVVRGRRRPARPRRVERVPLLTVQLRLLMQGDNNQATEVSRLNTFYPGQRLRLGIMANQNGYLAIFRQAAPGADAQRIFPDARANQGSNYVNRNVEYIVPSNCAAGVDCWYPVQGPAGSEIFTIIFSRDEDITEDIIEQATRNGGRITQQILSSAEAQSGQRVEILSRRPEGLVRGNPAGVHAVWFRNINTNNSEDIILTVPLIKGSPNAAAGRDATSGGSEAQTTEATGTEAITETEATTNSTSTPNSTAATTTTNNTEATPTTTSPRATSTDPNSTTTITTSPNGTTRIRTRTNSGTTPPNTNNTRRP
jgi:hypothetical protein